jgi:hypothetical protein
LDADQLALVTSWNGGGCKTQLEGKEGRGEIRTGSLLYFLDFFPPDSGSDAEIGNVDLIDPF